jgi:hypothetical protein
MAKASIFQLPAIDSLQEGGLLYRGKGGPPLGKGSSGSKGGSHKEIQENNLSVSPSLADLDENLTIEASVLSSKGGPPLGKGPGGSKGGGKGGGGHTETQGNNLSFPALLADGFSLTPITEHLFTVEYTGPYTGITTEQYYYLMGNGPWYAQKVEGNVWQAEYANVDDVRVSFIDWGDAMESVDPKIDRPYRLELALYAQLNQPMMGYKMAELAFPSSPQETQGTNKTTYDSDYATVATPKGKLVVQRYEPGAVLTWNGISWDGAYAPETGFGFAQELNVGGKYIFGASQGGWKPSVLGEYRVTFYFETGSGVSLESALIGDYAYPEPIVPKVAENNQPMVDVLNNLTYVDVTVVQSGGGGGGGDHNEAIILGASDLTELNNPFTSQLEPPFPVVAADI